MYPVQFLHKILYIGKKMCMVQACIAILTSTFSCGKVTGDFSIQRRTYKVPGSCSQQFCLLSSFERLLHSCIYSLKSHCKWTWVFLLLSYYMEDLLQTMHWIWIFPSTLQQLSPSVQVKGVLLNLRSLVCTCSYFQKRCDLVPRPNFLCMACSLKLIDCWDNMLMIYAL